MSCPYYHHHRIYGDEQFITDYKTLHYASLSTSCCNFVYVCIYFRSAATLLVRHLGCACVRACIYIYVCTYVCMYVCMYVCICMYVYIYVYIYI